MGFPKFRISSLFFVVMMAAACGSGPATRAAGVHSLADPAGLFQQTGREADDVARLLAGMPARPGSRYVALEKDPAWVQHAETLDRMWSRFERLREPGMKEFSKNELGAKEITDSLMFYPFGGPDALTVLTLFPHNREYVLAALEPPGTLPEIDLADTEWMKDELPRFARTLESHLRTSFFITREMDRELRGQVTDGLLPLFLVQLVRSHHTVVRFGYIALDEQGKMVPREKDQHRALFGKNRGLAIEYESDGGSDVRRLFYISVNLENRSFRENTSFLKFLAARSPVATMLKSTSYLTHQPQFTAIRDQILEKSSTIVQDDSGIPYRLLDPAVWDVQLYGDYDQPIRSFNWLAQADLREAYQDKDRVKKLGFPIGYGSSRMPSNLQVARRKS